MLLFIGLLISSLTIFNSCKKDELPSMSCKIGGTTWLSTFRVSVMGEIDLGGISGVLITATNGADANLADGEYFAILIRGNEVKSYDLAIAMEGAKFQCAAVYFPNGLNTATKFIGTSGTVEITKVDTDNQKISGTFSFEMKNSITDTDTKSITTGVFNNLKYTEPSNAIDLMGLF